MMRWSLLWFGLTFASIAGAEDIQPGLWEITLDTRVDGVAGFSPGPTTMQQCLTAADAANPGRVLGPLSNPGASGCTYTNRNYAGSSFRFSMTCAGALSLHTEGEVSYSATRMSGNITTTGNLMGQATRFSSAISARRLGGC